MAKKGKKGKSKNKDKKEEGEESPQNKGPKINNDDLIRDNLSELKLSFGKILILNPKDKKSVGYTNLVLIGGNLPKPLDSLGSSFSAYRNLRSINLCYNQISDYSYCKPEFK